MTLTPQQTQLVSEAREVLALFFNDNPIIGSWSTLMDYCQLSIADRSREAFHVLYLDSKNRLIEDHCHNVGTVAEVQIYKREVLKRAIMLNATAMLLVHNHPSGDPTPSRTDIEVTKDLVQLANMLDITVHDHVIVGNGKEFSFSSHGLLT